MVAAGGGVDARRAAELAGDDQQDVLVEAAVGQVLDEGGDRLIDLRGPAVCMPFAIWPVHVPAAEVEGHEADAGLAQPPGQQHAARRGRAP